MSKMIRFRFFSPDAFSVSVMFNRDGKVGNRLTTYFFHRPWEKEKQNGPTDRPIVWVRAEEASSKTKKAGPFSLSLSFLKRRAANSLIFFRSPKGARKRRLSNLLGWLSTTTTTSTFVVSFVWPSPQKKRPCFFPRLTFLVAMPMNTYALQPLLGLHSLHFDWVRAYRHK